MNRKTLPYSSFYYTHVILLLFVLLPQIAAAQPVRGLDPLKAISQYTHSIWRSDDGLPQNSVNAIVQDKNGYLWFGTQEGLVRFDGVKFVVVGRKRTEAIRSNYVWTMIGGPDTSIWVGTHGGGLTNIKGNVVQTYTVSDGLPSDLIVALCFDANNTLWIGTANGLVRWKERKFTTYTVKDGIPHNAVQVLCTDTKGRIWIGTGGGGLTCLENGKFTTYTVKDGLNDNTITSLHVGADGTLYIGTLSGLNVMKEGKIGVFRTRHGPIRSIMLSIHEDRAGALWLGTGGLGLMRVWQGNVEQFGREEGLSDDLVKSMCEDSEGNLWVGTYGGGVNRFTDSKFTSFTHTEGLSHDFVLSVTGDHNGTIWVGTYGGGLDSFKNGKFKNYNTTGGLAADIISSVYADRHGALWVGMYGKELARVQNGRVTRYSSLNGLSNNFIVSMYEDSKGTLWVGTQEGINRRVGNTFKPITADTTLLHSVILSIVESRDGTLWVGTEGKGLYRFQPELVSSGNGAIRAFTMNDGLASNFVTALYEDKEGTLWIGTDGGGLSRFKGGKFSTIDSKLGLSDDVAFSILEDQYGYLWFSCNKGVYRVSKQQLHDVAEGKIQFITSDLFNQADGMSTNECNGRRQPAAWKDDGGRLWYPTIKGVAMIDPGDLKINLNPPPVVIEAILVEENMMEPGRAIELPAGLEHVEFRYTALSFVAPEKIQFKYMLEGFDRQWISSGNRRTAYYTNVPPGTYTFRVKACNNDGVWSTKDASVVVGVGRFFYQSWYFYAASVFVIGFLVVGGYRVRVMRHRRREQELVAMVEERTKDLRQEIAQRTRVEEALRTSDQKLRDIIEHSTNLFYVHDTNHVLQYLSPQTRTFFDCEPEEALVRWTEFVSDNPINQIGFEFTEQAIKTGKPQPVYELELQTKMGRRVRVEVREAPVVRDGKTVAIVGALTDITEKKKLEEQLIQGQKLQSLGTLAGGIAHNFNNILGIILAYASMLHRERDDTTRFDDGINAIQTTIGRGAALVRQLLTFARKTDIKLEIVDVNATVRELAKMISETFPKTISFVLQLAQQLPKIKLDYNQLNQVLLNLCVNARDAMVGEGTLSLTTGKVAGSELARRFATAKEGEYVSIAVTDTGMGMDEATRRRVFEPFFTTKDIGKGTGLGLSVVYGIIESQHGFIEVQSEVGKGATFTVHLPVTVSDEKLAEAMKEFPKDIPGGTEKILIVEDEELLVDLLKSLLERKGYTVLTATDGIEAMELYEAHHKEIDLVLMDIGLPRLGGWETLHRMKEINPNVQVILASGYLESNISDVSREEGAQAFIAKPYIPEKVQVCVREVLDKAKG